MAVVARSGRRKEFIIDFAGAVLPSLRFFG